MVYIFKFKNFLCQPLLNTISEVFSKYEKLSFEVYNLRAELCAHSLLFTLLYIFISAFPLSSMTKIDLYMVPNSLLPSPTKNSNSFVIFVMMYGHPG